MTYRKHPTFARWPLALPLALLAGAALASTMSACADGSAATEASVSGAGASSSGANGGSGGAGASGGGGPAGGGGGTEAVPFSRVCVKPLSQSVRGQFGVQSISSVTLPASFPQTFTVSTQADFSAAMTAAGPGDRILIADGTYSWGDYTIGNALTGGDGFDPQRRLWIMPDNQGAVTFVDTRFEVAANHITFFDLKFVNANFTLRAPATRITFCIFTGGGAAVTLNPRDGVAVNDVEIDNNLFTGQDSDAIAMITRPAGNEATYPTPQRTWIHHNRIQDHTNGGRPCIGAGVGWHPFPDDQPAHTLIEYNSFDNCTADDEVVELKHRGAWIRYNLIENSGLGHLSGRMTGNAHYTGNIHLGGGSHGFRMFGNDNVGVFNLMQTLRSITTSPTEPIEPANPNIDYDYLAMVNHHYTMNVFWESSVWMNVQDTAQPNVAVSRDNTIVDNFWLGGTLDYSDPAGDTPYEVWLANNPDAAFPGQNWLLNEAGDNCYDTSASVADFSPLVVAGEWSAEHRGEPSADVVHRLPFWWFDLLSFEQ